MAGATTGKTESTMVIQFPSSNPNFSESDFHKRRIRSIILRYLSTRPEQSYSKNLSYAKKQNLSGFSVPNVFQSCGPNLCHPGTSVLSQFAEITFLFYLYIYIFLRSELAIRQCTDPVTVKKDVR